MSANNSFFEESKDQSQVKSMIVAKYFSAWASVMVGAQNRYRANSVKKLAYIDLFAGPGRYRDGTKSTPIIVLEKALQDEVLRERLVTVFNDKDPSNTSSLQDEIDGLQGIDALKFKPQIYTEEVGEEIVKMFEKMSLVPTLFFVDPWWYKGLSLRLVNSVLKDWGCDCIFFFNYNRINMGINNEAVKPHVEALFGPDRVDEIRARLGSGKLTSSDREIIVIDELCQSLQDLGPRYVLPFRFRDDRGSRTSHHLIFVSKGFKGYEIMKEIMAKECSSNEQGVPSFEYNPVDGRTKLKQLLLFNLSRPLDDLAEMLLGEFAGQKLTMEEIYQQHNVDRPYIKKNYKDVLKTLEEDGKITVGKHRKGTFGDNVVVTFHQG
ncbi:MAG: three-Cys-motif partner protein TcmP [Planctomycetes bacterium]|nr:three-Cys-motif partner protein TcmP [Planctomycetota bacterium]